MLAVWIVGGIIVAVFLLTALIGAPYVPTHKKQASAAFTTLRPVKKTDVVLDIGSGDGVVLLQALQAGVGRVVGYEINPFLVWISRLRLLRWRQNVHISVKNFWESSFPSDVTVVYTFGESRDIGKMYAKVQREATRIGKKIDFISYAFAVPNQLEKKKLGALLLYEVSPLQKNKT